MFFVFVRYRTDGKGKSIPVAKVYTPKEHPIRNYMIDKDALNAIRRLQQSGAEAYIVGGSIRDLLLNKDPKDFDIATSASPRQVQRLFWNSRIIGRRFRIVHLFFGEKILEVTTFRSDEENFEEGKSNVYGTIEQDASRRDFSINALYYDPKTGNILDFNDGYQDMKRGVIRSLIPLKYAFTEDPVRMIRALKYQASTGFVMKHSVKRAIRRNSQKIAECSVSRLTEEVTKILSGGYAYKTIKNLYDYDVLPHLLPYLSDSMESVSLTSSLNELDVYVRSKKEEGVKLAKSDLLYYLVKPLIVYKDIDGLLYDEVKKDIYRQAKIIISPITPPNYELEKAVIRILMDLGIEPKKKAPPKQRPRGVKEIQAQGTTRSRRKRRRRYPYSKRPSSEAISSQDEAKSLAESHDL